MLDVKNLKVPVLGWVSVGSAFTSAHNLRPSLELSAQGLKVTSSSASILTGEEELLPSSLPVPPPQRFFVCKV